MFCEVFRDFIRSNRRKNATLKLSDNSLDEQEVPNEAVAMECGSEENKVIRSEKVR